MQCGFNIHVTLKVLLDYEALLENDLIFRNRLESFIHSNDMLSRFSDHRSTVESKTINVTRGWTYFFFFFFFNKQQIAAVLFEHRKDTPVCFGEG